VENAFGHLKARFRRVGKGLDNKIENTAMIIKACCVLNNFLNSQKDKVNINWIQQQVEIERTSHRRQPDLTVNLNARSGILIRNAISLHFMDELGVDGNEGFVDDVDGNEGFLDDVDGTEGFVDDVDGNAGLDIDIDDNDESVVENIGDDGGDITMSNV